MMLETYAVIHKSDTIRMMSRSGGVFTAISDYILEQGGVVYGVVLNGNFSAVHVRATNKELRDKMRGSKYIQSDMQQSFENIRNDLQKGNWVLFSGTSCQVAGLKNYLEKDYERLLCVDIVCHGTPSLAVWKKYLEYQEHRLQSTILSVDFRNKKEFGWRSHVESIYMENGVTINSEVFKNLFYGHEILRPSCYVCRYKSITHPGDITIADYWGIEKAAPDLDDNKGVSLVLVNTEKGKTVFENVKSMVMWRETKIADSMQPPLKAPFSAPVDRVQFWQDFIQKPFSVIVKIYASHGVVTRIRRILRKVKWKLKLHR